MKFYGKTDIGKIRKENQDRFGFKELDGMTVLAVCDGMGGATGGSLAAEIALDTFLSYCEKELTRGLEDTQIRSILSLAVCEANSAVIRKSSEDSSLAGMGTTLVAALVPENSDYIFIINVGDSRAYMVYPDKLEQVSHDHSYVQLLIDMGEITPEEAETHPKKNVITRAIGTSETTRGDIDKIDIKKPSYLLLCTDGLTGMVNERDIKLQIDKEVSLEESVDSLIDMALDNGGEDNVTILISEL